MTPSAPWSHGSASAGDPVAGVSSIGSATMSSRIRLRSANGRSSSDSSPRARMSKATNVAGVFSASIATRDAAGWMRSWSASKSSPPSGVRMTSSPSST